ncbi:MAG TPA: hypothetical protein VGH38_14620 [Bryobacteraceae bacterium]|jgi:hypothetical protein
MTPAAGGYKAQYDYVELIVEPRDNHWLLTLWDRRHGENVVHEEKFDTAGEAQDAALAVAQHHINVQHNDTLVLQSRLSWQKY